ncbi:MAG: hypothetical protein ACKVX7_14295 [Planctomycetota bacterium]
MQPSARPHGESGLSLVDLLIAISLLTLGVLAHCLVAFDCIRLAEASRTNDQVVVALRNAIGELRQVPFNAIETNFGAGSGQEAFWLDLDGQLAFVEPTDFFATGGFEFFTDEDSLPAEFGATNNSLDLNGNGSIEAGTISNYKVLPVRISLALNPRFGAIAVSYPMYLSE